MLATVRRFFQQGSPQKVCSPQPAPVEAPSTVLEPESHSPQRPRLLGPRFTEPASPESSSRSRSRSRSPAGRLSPPASPDFPDVDSQAICTIGRRSSIATRKRLSCSRSPPISRRRSFAARRSVVTRTRLSYSHRDFANPEAETCWLSCLFQALWHSVVFHKAFEKDLVTETYAAKPEESLLTALQQTWEEYRAEDKPTMEEDEEEEETVGKRQGQSSAAALVTADGLVGGFGEGYGDMSEALACLQSELSDSANLAAVALSERMVLLPLAASEGVLPSPELAWKQALEWQVSTASLISVDITVPELTRESIESFVRLWVPEQRATVDQENMVPEQTLDVAGSADESKGLPPGTPGSSHKLVALVCYMFHLQHYVAFCQRQSNSARCCFFNDLPELTKGLPKEVEWDRVPSICAEFSLTPRLVLYESTAMAGEATQ